MDSVSVGAVELDEGLLPAAGQEVQARGNQLLAGAALADNQHRFAQAGGARHMFHHGKERRGLADNGLTFGHDLYLLSGKS